MPVQGHGIDGEIPPGQVLLQGGDKDHRVGPPPVGVGPIGAVGGHLVGIAVQEHRHRAVAQPGGEDLLPGKDL